MIRLALIAIAPLLLAACDAEMMADDGGGAMDGAMMDGGGAVPGTTMSGAIRTGSEAAEIACMNAVRAETNNPEILTMSSEFSQANTVVMVGVGPQQAPWRCLSDEAGNVAEVTYVGQDEGAL